MESNHLRSFMRRSNPLSLVFANVFRQRTVPHHCSTIGTICFYNGCPSVRYSPGFCREKSAEIIFYFSKNDLLHEWRDLNSHSRFWRPVFYQLNYTRILLSKKANKKPRNFFCSGVSFEFCMFYPTSYKSWETPLLLSTPASVKAKRIAGQVFLPIDHIFVFCKESICVFSFLFFSVFIGENPLSQGKDTNYIITLT